ncbi:MAG: hypothetical protein HOE90_10390 [Bacteriovoracaceae bacterium]|jgi:hypothetical protein|nr:hypothetical protein [Bacteriovoracaceae bacterium]
MASILFVLLSFQVHAWEGPTYQAKKAQIGKRNLTHKAYSVSPGFYTLTEKTFNRLSKVWPRELRKRLKRDPSKFRELAYQRYGFLKAPYDNKGAPLGFVVKPDGRWEGSCFMCHAGSVGGKVILGLGNNQIDIGTFTEDRIKQIKRYPISSNAYPINFPKALSESLMVRLYERSYFSKYRHQLSKGTPNVVSGWSAILGGRNIDMDPFGFPRSLKINVFGSIPVDSDMPAWFTTSVKSRIWVDGFSPLTRRTIMSPAAAPLNPEFKKWESEFDDVLHYIKSLKAPSYENSFPGRIDWKMAKKGEDHFYQSCSNCHGDYERVAGVMTLLFPEERIPLSKLKTDPARVRKGLTVSWRQFYQNSWLGNYGKDKFVVDPKGYMAPPLLGVWATAPYLHNGSVPTLYHLLFESERPKIWKVTDYKKYDHKNMGLSFNKFLSVPIVYDNEMKRRFFDTTGHSKSNKGHSFGSELSEQQKWELLEYLKTL